MHSQRFRARNFALAVAFLQGLAVSASTFYGVLDVLHHAVSVRGCSASQVLYLDVFGWSSAAQVGWQLYSIEAFPGRTAQFRHTDTRSAVQSPSRMRLSARPGRGHGVCTLCRKSRIADLQQFALTAQL